jgi:cob(I)alamin adenosyltransferase
LTARSVILIIHAMSSGKIHVYTGNGKGKTTAGLGLVIRASGHGMSVKFIQFMKGSTKYGELNSLAKLCIEVVQYGTLDFVDINNPKQIDISEARKALADVKLSASSGKYDIVVADEINVAMGFGLITIRDVLDMIESKNDKTELIMTGRMAPPEVVNKADLVTEMREIKHYYREEELDGRMGIEY